MKHIALFVILALTGIFAYQVYWLAGLYQQEKARLERSIREAVRVSDYKEIMHRVQLLREDEKGVHGKIDISTSLTSTYHGKPVGTQGLSTVTHTQFVHRDTAQQEEQWKMRRLVRKKQPISILYDTKKTTGTVLDDSVHADMDNDAVNMLSDWDSMLRLGVVIQRGIHSAVDAISRPDLTYLDRVLTRHLDSIGIQSPHQLLYLYRGIERDSVPFTDTLAVIGRPINADTVVYSYDNNLINHTAYQLILPPSTSVVVRQMGGILTTSLVIILLLAFVFWYLVRTIRQQKTLDEMKSDFTNNMTHELKTPIAVAYAANDALLNFDAAADRERSRRYLVIIQQQLRQLSSLVEQILAMSMERRRTMKLTMEPVDIRALLQPVIAEQRLKADKPIDVTLQIPHGMTVTADRAHLAHILGNMIDNAVKYSAAKAEITVSAFRDGPVTEIDIADRGIGIAPEQQRYLFDKFYRVPHGNRYEVKGYGLGLYYVRTMMQRFGGTVTVESRPGIGSTFKLRFNG